MRALRVLLGKCGLAQPGGWLPFACHAYLPNNVTQTGAWIYSVTISRPFTIREWIQCFAIGTTNNASNYWGVQLRRLDNNVSLKTFSTSSYSPGVWNRLEMRDLDIAVSESMKGIYLRIDKMAGSPGPISFTAPAVFVT